MLFTIGTPEPGHHYSTLHNSLYQKTGALYTLMTAFKWNFNPHEDRLPPTYDMAKYASQSPAHTEQVSQLICSKIAVNASREYLEEWCEFAVSLRGSFPPSKSQPEKFIPVQGFVPQQETALFDRVLADETMHLLNFGGNEKRYEMCLRLLEQFDTCETLRDHEVILHQEQYKEIEKQNTGKTASGFIQRLMRQSIA